jgi:hypothetical protein
VLKTSSSASEILINVSFWKLIPLDQSIDQFVSIPLALCFVQLLAELPLAYCQIDTGICILFFAGP